MADDPNEICRVCGEPRSAHVPTEKGQLTHPREARGEGEYRQTGGSFGTQGFGLNCSECGGACSMDHAYDTRTFKFVPKTAPFDWEPDR